MRTSSGRISGFGLASAKTIASSPIAATSSPSMMFGALTPANDLSFRYGINAPTLRIDGMTVAGG